jgi:hypothetical protein
MGLLKNKEKVTRLYRDVEFCSEYLHIPYSEFLKLPRWERKMYDVYLDIKTRRQKIEDERLEMELEEQRQKAKAEE